MNIIDYSSLQTVLKRSKVEKEYECDILISEELLKDIENWLSQELDEITRKDMLGIL